MSLKSALLGVICCVTPTLLHAQARPEDVSADQLGEAEVEELVVTASGRPRGAALGDVPPEVTFNAGDVRSLGVSSINELLAELAPQTTSGRGGAPVVLLGGRRVSSMAEVRDIPTEAIARVEVLPEEVALKYGYAASQKVVNIVLRQRFRANTAEASLSAPTKGGQATAQLDGARLQLNNEGRLNLAVRYQRSDALRESNRDIVSADGSGPYALEGNITSAVSGAQIDPQLSALAGAPVTVAGVPGRAAAGPATLSDFAALAGAPNSGDVTDLRSLRPRTQQVSVNAVINRTVFDNVGATLNLSASHLESTALLGPARTRLTLPGANPFSPFQDDVVLYRYRGDLDALEQNSRTVNGHVGVTFDGDVKSWRWTLTGNYDRTGTRTLTDRGIDVSGLQGRLDALDPGFNPFGALPYADFNLDRARSLSDTGDLQLVLNGVLMRLPAGDLSTTVKVGAEGARLESYSRRAGLETEGTLSRETGKFQVSMDAPLAKTSVNDIPFVGNLSANVNLAVDSLSDFGELTTVGYGLTWSPVSPLSVVASMTDEETAPSMQQLGGPVIATPDSRVFDFVNGETVDVTRVSGGNPDLKAQDSQTFKAQMTFRPPQVTGLTLNATYLRTRTDNLIAAFPAATAETEAAFPGRFLRDLDGTLIRIDARPVNFERQESDQIRWGLNFSRQIGGPPPRTGGAPGQRRAAAAPTAGGPPSGASPQAGGAPAAVGEAPAGMNLLQGALPQGQRPPEQRPDNPLASPGDRAGPGGGFGPGGRGPGFGGGFGGGATRIQFAVYHTLHLRERVVIADGLAPLDLLDGDALNSGGGQPRHEVEVQTGITRRGMGARISANWQSATEVDGGVSGATGRLRFSDLTTVNLRLFANLGAQREWVARYPVLRGMRVTLSVDNLFDAQMDVKDAAGVTPINYQPDYLDPLGRSVRLSVRKVFF